MEDKRVWEFEEGLWKGDAQHYKEAIDDECLMVLPEPPYVMHGQQAISAVTDTPRWDKVTFSKQHIARPQEGLIVVAYHASVEREGTSPYVAHCTSSYRRLSHDEWRVVQHQQTPPILGTKTD